MTRKQFAEYVYLDCKDGITLSHDELIEAFLKDLDSLSLPPVALTAEEMADKKLKEILGDRLCSFCPLEIKGVYGVPGGFMAGCEGSKCDEALDEAIHEFAAQRQPQPTAEGAEEISAASYIRNTWGEAWLRNMWEAGDVISALEEFAALTADKKLREDTYMTCDVCGCHPSVIITTSFGKFCQQHAKYV